ncbi:MAG: stage III sporulation AC/AD family protein [Clostridia bacterium]|nr:stage III sporulation AC/AD family protein [Clostridia bacterium]
MSEELLKAFGIAILGALAAVILRRWNGELGMLFKIAAAIALCIGAFALMSPVIDKIRELSEGIQLSEALGNAAGVLIKVLCVAWLSHVCATVCRDCGESSIAYYAELCGKIEIIVLSLPLFEEILNMAQQLMENSA